jgi:hypothetical protein
MLITLAIPLHGSTGAEANSNYGQKASEEKNPFHMYSDV